MNRIIMRIGEIKKIIGEVLDENEQIVVESEAVYGGQAFEVDNYQELHSALEILFEQDWNDAEDDSVRDILSKHPAVEGSVILDQAEHNQLKTYINAVNQKMPLFYSVLDSVVEDQDELVINVRLPIDKVNLVGDLNKINTRLDKLFKEFAVDGQFEFRGFDTGTDWYMLQALGVLSYGYFLAGLKAAKEVLKLRTEYYKSEKAKLEYEAMLKSIDVDVKFDKNKFEKYVVERLKQVIDEKVRAAIDEIKETNGETEESMHNKLVVATTELVKELGNGTEFHLSLNPPEYVQEQAGALTIDYAKMREIEVGDNEESKQLSAPAEEAVEDKEDE